MFYISSSHLGLYNSNVYHGSYLTGSFETNILDKKFILDILGQNLGPSWK